MNDPTTFPPSPPHSVARSSVGTGLSQSGSRKFSMQALESELEIHHRVLRDFLNQSIRDDRAYQPHNRARDKLLRLSAIQFQELSTDVYDELLRREEQRSTGDGGPERTAPRFLLPKSNFHPKRNQARQKLSTLASTKFRELATDVLFELERRVPRLANNSIDRAPSPTGSTASYRSRGPGRSNRPGMSVQTGGQFPRRPSATSPSMPYSPGIFEGGERNIPGSASSNENGRPFARQLQSNTMVPTKSTMVEDDDSDDGSAFNLDGQTSRRTTAMSGNLRLRDSRFTAEQQAQIVRLEQTAADLEAQLKQKDEQLLAVQKELSDKAGELDKNLSADIERLQARNMELEELLAQQSADSAATQQLQTEHHETQQAYRALQGEHAEMEQAYQALHGEHAGTAQAYQALQEEHEQMNHAHSDLVEEHTNLKESHEQLAKDHARSQDGGEWETRCTELQGRLDDLRQVTDEVREEGAQTLDYLAELSKQHDEAEAEREEMTSRISELESAVEEWQSRYAKAKSQLRNLNARSMGLDSDLPDASQCALDPSLVDANGFIQDIHVTQYQMAINELLRLSRTDDSTAVWKYMQVMGSACNSITKDATQTARLVPRGAGAGAGEDTDVDRDRAVQRVHAAGKSLLTVMRQYSATSLTPVAHLDAAAGNLTAAVIGLVGVVKIRFTPEAASAGPTRPSRKSGHVRERSTH